jgi:Cytochrome P460
MTSYHTQLVDDEGNDDRANFPEYRNVYTEPCAYEAYKTGVFPNGTIFHKEFQLTSPGQNANGSRTEPSGDFSGAAAPHEGCSGRYGGRNVMIYWHVERGSVCIRSTESLGCRVGSAHHHRLKSTKAFETSYS